MSDLLNIGKLSIPKITVGKENVSEISLGRIKLWPNDITEIWGTQIVEVTNPITSRVWMDRNIGATRAALSLTDSEAYGHLFQWGRNPDGHELRTSLTTSTLSSTDVPGHSDFIIGNFDWLSFDWANPMNLWQDLSFGQWRLPTRAEWEAEIATWDLTNDEASYNSILKVPLSGYKMHSDGILGRVGARSLLWTNELHVDWQSIYVLYLESYNNELSAYIDAYGMAYGASVRLIKD